MEVAFVVGVLDSHQTVVDHIRGDIFLAIGKVGVVGNGMEVGGRDLICIPVEQETIGVCGPDDYRNDKVGVALPLLNDLTRARATDLWQNRASHLGQSAR